MIAHWCILIFVCFSFGSCLWCIDCIYLETKRSQYFCNPTWFNNSLCSICSVILIQMSFIQCSWYCCTICRWVSKKINIPHSYYYYYYRSLSGRDSSNCSMNCNCSSTIFEPVCGNDGITYFSPCRAGCDKREIDNVRPVQLTNCLY